MFLGRYALGMVSKTVIVLSCDLCSTEGDGVVTHTVRIDKKEVEVEACGRCWTKAEKVMTPILESGRKLASSKRSS